MRGSAHFFLRNTMAKDIITMNFYELKVQFSVILSILRYLMALNEHLDVSLITEKCWDEICSVLKILCDYTMWMICRGTYIICIHKGTLGTYFCRYCYKSTCMHLCTNTYLKTTYLSTMQTTAIVAKWSSTEMLVHCSCIESSVENSRETLWAQNSKVRSDVISSGNLLYCRKLLLGKTLVNLTIHYEFGPPIACSIWKKLRTGLKLQ